MGSTLMMDFLRLWEAHSASDGSGTQITSLRGSGRTNGGRGGGAIGGEKRGTKNKAVGAV